MHKDRKCIVVLTTREGSKRLPDKNLMVCHGKPLVMWVVDEIFKCDFIDEVYHISNSEKLKELLSSAGCITIDEPEELSVDTVPILTVLKYAVEQIDCDGSDYIIWADVSKPLTKSSQIEKVIRTAAAGDYDSVFTTKKLRYYLADDPAIVTQKRDELKREDLYFGAVRLRTAKTIRNAELNTWGRGEFHLDLCICEDHEIDVDYLHDFICAEALLKAGY